MELRGLADFILCMLDNNGKAITDPDKGLSTNGIFKVDLNSSAGAVQANITGLSTTPEKVYGSNAVAEQNIGTIQPQIALTANDIPHDVYDKLAGLTEDATNGGYAARSGTLVQGGVIVHSQNREGTIDAYFAFPFGVFTPGELNIQTNQQNPTVVHDALTLSVQARPTDALVYQKFYSDEDKFDYEKMLEYVFPGYSSGDPSKS
jgi:hypothetical protein